MNTQVAPRIVESKMERRQNREFCRAMGLSDANEAVVNRFERSIPVLEYGLYIARSVRENVNFAICRVFGHGQLDDEGYGNPDSGCMDIRCQRCGARVHFVRLY